MLDLKDTRSSRAVLRHGDLCDALLPHFVANAVTLNTGSGQASTGLGPNSFCSISNMSARAPTDWSYAKQHVYEQ